MKRATIAILALACMLLPLTALAGEGRGKKMMDKGMQMGKDKGMQMDMGDDQHMDMKMPKGMIMLENEVVDGILGLGHLKDHKAAMGEMKMGKKKMGKMKMDGTHNFSVMFQHPDTKEYVTEGKAALKVKSPNGETGKAIMLTGKGGNFAADVALADKGTYEFYVATRLEDGKKREYHFSYDYK